jgi:hypothetical protein
VMARKSIYFRRPLTINHQQTNVRIIKLSKSDNYLEKIGGFSAMENDLCFFIQNIQQFDTFLFNMSIDVVATDIFHTVVKIMPRVNPDNILHLPKHTHNIFILKAEMANVLGIKLNDFLYTH